MTYVGGGAHKGNGNDVDAFPDGEDKVFLVFFRERGGTDENARQVDPFALTQHAAVDDVADDIVAGNFMDAQLDEAVRKQDARALFQIFGERLVVVVIAIRLPGWVRAYDPFYAASLTGPLLRP